MLSPNSHKTDKGDIFGFTIIEMLVIVAVVVVLALLALPTFRKAIQASQQSACSSNLRQIFLAINLYASDHNENLPPAENSDFKNFAYISLRDYVPSSDLTIWGGNKSGKGIFCCPALRGRVGVEKAGGSSNYGLNRTIWYELNNNSTFSEVSKLKISHPSKTILAGDVAWMVSGGHPFATIHWYLTPGKNEGVTPPSHPVHTLGAANLLFADGHVEYWKDTSVLSDPKYGNKGEADLWSPVK